MVETYLARAQENDPLGDGVPNFVEARFHAYLPCGILAHGFARARGSGHDFLVAFSCKGRGICPSRNSRCMAAPAARLASGGCPTDHVIPGPPADAPRLLSRRRPRGQIRRRLSPPPVRGEPQPPLPLPSLRPGRRVRGVREAWAGFSLDASVRIAAHDRANLERLLRGHSPQVGRARPPFSLNRIE